jgi:hypothetical protein
MSFVSRNLTQNFEHWYRAYSCRATCLFFHTILYCSRQQTVVLFPYKYVLDVGYCCRRKVGKETTCTIYYTHSICMEDIYQVHYVAVSISKFRISDVSTCG